MVFLTMCPKEIEHTMEPPCEKDIYWPPAFHLQPFSDSTPRSEALETGNASGSQGESNIAGFISSKDKAPPEHETPLEHSVSKGNAEATIIKPAPLQERPMSGEKMSDTVQTLSTDVSPLVGLKHRRSLVTSVEPFSSGNVMAEGESRVSNSRLQLSKITLLGWFRF